MAANPAHRPLHTFEVSWEITTRANFELTGALVVKATSEAQAIARVKERVGWRYAIPDASVETPYIELLSVRR
jgi:hypothetical protein